MARCDTSVEKQRSENKFEKLRWRASRKGGKTLLTMTAIYRTYVRKYNIYTKVCT
jgi:hypothetical protein